MKNYIYIFFITFLMSSCNNYLDKIPLDKPSDVSFLSNQTELDMAVTGIYNNLIYINSGMQFQLYLETITDNATERSATVDMDSQSALVVGLWRNLYVGIARSNYVLANMERGKVNIDASIYNQRRAEVRFLRALFYHYLVEYWGGVPLVTKPLTIAEGQLSRNSKEEVVNFILTELDECANDLPEKNDPKLGRATKGAAWALLSRVALYNAHWDTAISAAEKVMNLEGTQYILDTNYQDLFQYNKEYSKERIFSVMFKVGVGSSLNSTYQSCGSRNAGAFTSKVPTQQLVDSYECTDGLQIDKSPLYDPQHPFKNRDPRLGYSIACSGSTFCGYQFETNGDSVSCWNFNTTPASRVPNNDVLNAYATFTGYCFRKYVDYLDFTSGNSGRNELDFCVIRYAEVLLNYAEAKIKAGKIDQSVLAAINKVRQRPSVNMPPITTTDQNKLFYAVCRERKYELAFEGTRWFDILRWRIAGTVRNMPALGRMKKTYPNVAPTLDEWGSPNYDKIPVASPGESSDYKLRLVRASSFDPAKNYVWPIPSTELQTNLKMVQNPGY